MWLNRSLLVFLLLAGSVSSAQGSLFAAFSVTPYGDQIFDFATDITTLPQGGQIVARDSDVTLSGAFIKYRDGVFVEAQGAKVEGSFGTLEAPLLLLDLEKDVISASGRVSLSGASLLIRADSLRIFLEPEVAVAEGQVAGERPELESRALLIDLVGKEALLLGPYRFSDGPFVLRGRQEADALEIDWTDDAPEPEFAAATEVSAELLEKLESYLPE